LYIPRSIVPKQSSGKFARATAKVAIAAPMRASTPPVRKPLRRPTRRIHIDAGNAAMATPIT
jgi:hypothetical protein